MEKKKKLNPRLFIISLLKPSISYERSPVCLQRTTSSSQKPALDAGLQFGHKLNISKVTRFSFFLIRHDSNNEILCDVETWVFTRRLASFHLVLLGILKETLF